MQKFKCPPDLNLFSEVDHLIVRQAMALLPRRQLKALTLRYWERLSETEICIAMNTDWRTVERLITSAYERLKEICLLQPEFSRSRPIPVSVPNHYQAEVSSYAS
jgi:DNA-directed RNA polymerase specialized sigma24 family protein